jgi:hypothetical protein
MPCFCTTAVVILAPNAIVSGTDRLGMNLHASTGVATATTTATKIVLLRSRFVVACIGLERLSSHKAVLYAFPHWIRGIESQVSPNTSVLQLVKIIEKESSRTFTETIPIETMMKSGALKPSQSFDKFFVQFIVAGFDNKAPTLIQVFYELDWQSKRLIGPTRKIEFPLNGAKGAVFTSGINSAIEHFRSPDTYAYKRMNVLIPTTTFSKPITALTPEESIQLVRRLIGIEAELEPSRVGMGDTIIVLPVTGEGWIDQYDPPQTLPKAGKRGKHD